MLANIEEFQYDNHYFWSPDLYIVNAVNVKEEIRYSFKLIEKKPNMLRNVNSSEIRKSRDVTASSFVDNLSVLVTETRKVRGVFYERLELNDFPIDLQELSVTLSSNKSTEEVLLLEDKTKENFVNTSRFYDQQQWDLYGFCIASTDNTYDQFKDINRSEIKFTSFVSRKFQFYIYK